MPPRARRFLAATGSKGRAYDTCSLLFASAFLATRALGYGMGLVDLCLACDYLPLAWDEVRKESEACVVPLVISVLIPILRSAGPYSSEL